MNQELPSEPHVWFAIDRGRCGALERTSHRRLFASSGSVLRFMKRARFHGLFEEQSYFLGMGPF